MFLNKPFIYKDWKRESKWEKKIFIEGEKKRVERKRDGEIRKLREREREKYYKREREKDL